MANNTAIRKIGVLQLESQIRLACFNPQTAAQRMPRNSMGVLQQNRIARLFELLYAKRPELDSWVTNHLDAGTWSHIDSSIKLPFPL